jgi:acylphosphatase
VLFRSKACLTVEGKVQKVGYRDKVQEIARECKLVGKVKNMEDGTVEIICEGGKKVIEDFKKRIKIKDELIDVKNISASYEEPTGEFKYFKIEYGGVAEEIAESIGAGRSELVAVKQEVGGLRGDTIKGLSAVKQEVHGLRNDMNQNFDAMDRKYLRISKNIETLTREIRNSNKNIQLLAKTFVRMVNALENKSWRREKRP